jgi:hypothetical protein
MPVLREKGTVPIFMSSAPCAEMKNGDCPLFVTSPVTAKSAQTLKRFTAGCRSWNKPDQACQPAAHPLRKWGPSAFPRPLERRREREVAIPVRRGRIASAMNCQRSSAGRTWTSSSSVASHAFENCGSRGNAEIPSLPLSSSIKGPPAGLSTTDGPYSHHPSACGSSTDAESSTV